MNAGAPVVKLDWDSRHFGIEVAKIPTGAWTGQELQAALDYCRSESVRCLYFLADSKDVDSWTRAIEAGFRPVDVRVDLERGEPDTPMRSADRKPVDLATEAELPELLRLARFAFKESRFYRDKNFPPGKADELFARWTERGVRDPEFFTVIRQHERSPVGFLTGRVADDGSGRIELVAVSDEFRGRRISAQLLTAGLGEFWRRGCRAVSVTTQGSNIAAQRLYQAHGFRTRSVHLWFHLWIR
jgi:dTDP-4-amino-4,6-dideoxy-D-galactose acyltransferase